MIKIGNYNNLRVVKTVDFGIYLDGEEAGEILMPLKYVPQGTVPEDFIDVFIYSDSEDRLIATTETPYAKVNEFAYLKVKAVNKFGAFLDWGILKDLLVPFREQKSDMIQGKSYIVYIYLDEKTNRLAATAKINKFISSNIPEYTENSEVEILIEGETEIGYKAIVENQFSGLLYKNEVFTSLFAGDKKKAFVKKVRTDGKIDLTLQKVGYEQIDDISKKILRIIKENKGFIAANDNSSPEMIKVLFGISKKSFKKAIGSLYKERLIVFEADGLRLVDK
jgi:predicted RNA-binding protein (virulence factor B family)